MDIYHVYHRVLHYASNLEPQHWVIILAVIIALGAFFLRGFGSRAKF